jgi:methylisocitrate lyase
MNPLKKLRSALQSKKLIMVTNVMDPFSGRLAEQTGFDMLGIGGYQLGGSLCVSEPLLTLNEIIDATRSVCRSVSIPVTVDCGAGFGEPLHVMRTVREIEAAGASAITIEDQIFPKRVHYHRDYKEKTISSDEMINKIKAMVKARKNPEFVIMARTDSMRTEGYEEGMRRAKLFFEAGADVVKIFPNTLEEAKLAPSEVKGPLYYIKSIGNRVNRPVLSRDMASEFGYQFLSDAVGSMLTFSKAMKQYYKDWIKNGNSNLDFDEAIKLRKEIEDIIGLEEMYKIEEETVQI